MLTSGPEKKGIDTSLQVGGGKERGCLSFERGHAWQPGDRSDRTASLVEGEEKGFPIRQANEKKAIIGRKPGGKKSASFLERGSRFREKWATHTERMRKRQSEKENRSASSYSTKEGRDGVHTRSTYSYQD